MDAASGSAMGTLQMVDCCYAYVGLFNRDCPTNESRHPAFVNFDIGLPSSDILQSR